MTIPDVATKLSRLFITSAVLCLVFADVHVYMYRFCSVAYDTDKFFGSEGNFFESNYPMVSVCRTDSPF